MNLLSLSKDSNYEVIFDSAFFISISNLSPTAIDSPFENLFSSFLSLQLYSSCSSSIGSSPWFMLRASFFSVAFILSTLYIQTTLLIFKTALMLFPLLEIFRCSHYLKMPSKPLALNTITFLLMQCFFRLKSVLSPKLPLLQWNLSEKFLLNKTDFFQLLCWSTSLSLSFFGTCSLAIRCSFVSPSFPLLFRTELQFYLGIHLLSLRYLFEEWNGPL